MTAERLRELLHYDPETGVFVWLVATGRAQAGNVAGSRNRAGYRNIKINGRRYKAHRLAWLYMTGAWPRDEIDHVNLNREGNRWSNLREATRSQNGANRRLYRSNASGLKGVYWHKCAGKWAASIRLNGKAIHLGLFNTPEEAHKAYCAAARKCHREFARAA